MNKEILRMEHITKAFSGVKALDDAGFDLRAGEVHALMGANGAGKSTLMKILAGVYGPDAGKIFHNGHEVHIKADVASAQKDGVTMVFQELTILPHLSVLENIFISNEITKKGIYDWKAMRKIAKEVMAEVEIDLDLNARTGDLPVAMQQMVEIVRALNVGSEIIIFDEPTSSLTMQEVEHLFALMERLKEKGKAMVYISHRMDEIYRVADRITLMRDGKVIFSDKIENVSNERLISGIVGEGNTTQFPEKLDPEEEVIFEAKEVSLKGKYENINFQLKKGEILGFAGLQGAGRTEIAKTIFGYYHQNKGGFYYKGEPLKVKNPEDAVDKGIGYVSEDRKIEGILGVRSIKENMSIASLRSLSKGVRIDAKKEQIKVSELMAELKVKATGMNQKIESLSGGNQQKVCLGKWLITDSKLLLLDEPTKGIDVGARAEFYRIIKGLVEKGIGVIVISSEEDELIGLCNRIVVMREGKIMNIYNDDEPEIKSKIMKSMLDI